MSILVYSIQHPDSIDEQVTGIGLYRTVAEGVTPLLIKRFKFRDEPPASVTVPYDVVTMALGDGTDPVRPIDELFAMMALIAPTGTRKFRSVFKRNRIAFTGDADAGFIQDGGRIFEKCHRIAAPINTTGTSVIFHWESDTTATTSNRYAMATFRFEGFNTSANTTEEDAFADAPYLTYRVVDGDVPVKFAHYQTINTKEQFRVDDETYGSLGGGSGDTLGVRSLVADDDSVAPDGNDDEHYVTQVWERDDLTQDLYNLQDEFRHHLGERNAEDAQGRRATYRWEIALYDITQTWSWAYLDVLADAALGAQVEIDNDEPPAANQLSIFQEHAFLSGDPDNSHYLYWSKRFRPEAWPVENFVEIGTAADPIQTHGPLTGVLGVMTVQTKYRVAGNTTSGFIHDEAVSRRGTKSPKSFVITDRGAIFVSFDGVFSTNFIGPDQKLSDAIDSIFLGDEKNEYEKINWDYVHLIAGGFYKNKYYFSYPSGTSTANDMTAIFSFDTNEWTFWDVGFNSFLAENDTDLFLAGGNDGLVRIIEDPDAVETVSLELQTKDFVGTNPSTRNLFLYFKVDAECQGEEMTAQFYVDDELVQAHTLTGSRTNQLLRLPEDTHGYKWRVRVTYSGNKKVAVYGVTAIYIPLRAA